MARLARLSLARHPHLVLQRSLQGLSAFQGAADRLHFLTALQQAAHEEQVRVHAYALLEHEVWLVLTPGTEHGLARLMQAIGRRYVSAYNRRHGRSGTLWDGRYRSALLEVGSVLLDAMLMVDGRAEEPDHSSAAHHCGHRCAAWLHDPEVIWSLGNTPFEREASYRARLALGLPADRIQWLRRAAEGGWSAGTAEHAERIAALADRPSQPSPRGRPRKARV